MSKAVLIIIIIVLVVAVVWIFSLMFGSPFNNIIGGVKSNQSPDAASFMVEGVKVEILESGEGKGAKAGDLLTVDYISTLPDGKKVDSTYDRNRVFNFSLGEKKVIKGWDLGLLGMKVGEKRRLTVPPELAYGVKGFPGAGIPENAALIFEVRLLRLVTPKAE